MLATDRKPIKDFYGYAASMPIGIGDILMTKMASLLIERLAFPNTMSAPSSPTGMRWEISLARSTVRLFAAVK